MVIDNLTVNRLRNMDKPSNELEKTIKQLSSSVRTRKAAANASESTVSETLRSQIRGLDQAPRNTVEGQAVVQTAGEALSELNSILTRIRELSVQAANGTSSSTELENIQNEVAELRTEYDNIINNTEYNQEKLLDGTYTTEIQVGTKAGQVITLNIDSMEQSATGLDELDNSDSAIGTLEAIDVIDDAIDTVTKQQSHVAAVQNRIETAYAIQYPIKASLVPAEWQISDLDTAQRLIGLASQQAALNQMIEAQSKISPHAVLRLLS
jgi:flagellin